jgi:putative ABC transport system substrate-binding protein
MLLSRHTRRREFITLLGGAAAAWPLAARAQQPERMRRIGVLTTLADDEVGKARHAAFVHGLRDFGWIEGRNVRIDTRWGTGHVELTRKYARELVALAPDVILAGAGGIPAAIQATSVLPIVFVQSVDPIGAGFVQSLARPGGNATGFTQFEYNLSGKWPELLKEVAPSVVRAAVLRESGAAGIGQWAVIQAVSPTLRVTLSLVDTREPSKVERDVEVFAREPNGGMIIAASASGTIHRELIVMLAARHRLPAIYPYSFFVAAGGLISYGPNLVDQYRRAAGYVDRILRGGKPADLPVQAPTKYELAINLKTAKALGLEVPPTLLARADEVIE